MIRALTILAAVAALAVSAAPASARTPAPAATGMMEMNQSFSTKKPPRGTAFVKQFENVSDTLKAKPRIPSAGVTGGLDCVDCLMTSFGLQARPKPPRAVGTRSGGEVVSDFGMTEHDGATRSVKDGSSNTMMFGE